MPWPSNGDFYNFKEEAIRYRAPAVAGVYGIYNFKHHILIGHAKDIREALLYHQKKTNFRFRSLQPTGFTFEVCPAEFREFRARQLAWEYQPLIRTGETVGLAALWRSWTTPRVRAFDPQAGAYKPPVKSDRRPTQSTAAGNVIVYKESSRRDQFALAGTGLALSIVAIALFVLLGESRNVVESWTKQILLITHHFTAFADQSSPPPSAPPAPQVKATANKTRAQAGPAAPAIGTPAESQTNGADPSLEPAGAAATPSVTQAVPASVDTTAAMPSNQNESAKKEAAREDRSFKPWTVQALATTDINDARGWLERLKTKRYDAFIVETEIKGKQWYRVRVGSLSQRPEAEALSKILKSKEGFRDAFVARNAESDVVLASNSQ